MSDGYNAYVFIGNELKSAGLKILYTKFVCLMPRTSLSRLPIRVVEPTAERFSEILKEFFMRERKYDDAGFTSKERLRERQGLATKELLIELRSLLDSEQSKDSEFRSRYYREALNYLNRFWKEIFDLLGLMVNYRLDNNLAERTIRKTDHSTQQFTSLW